MSLIIDFYQCQAMNDCGLMLPDMWLKNHAALEESHDYIQWMFPLNESSRFNHNAPVLSEEDIYKFNDNQKLKDTLAESLNTMLAFYGLELRKSGYESSSIVVDFAANFDERSKVWVTPGNHNFLRITRILKCLLLLGQTKYAMAFFRCLELIYSDKKRIIGEDTFRYWSNAIRYGLTLSDLRRRLHMEKIGFAPLEYVDHNRISHTVSDLIAEVESNTQLGTSIVAISGLLRTAMQNDPDISATVAKRQSKDFFDLLE